MKTRPALSFGFTRTLIFAKPLSPKSFVLLLVVLGTLLTFSKGQTREAERREPTLSSNPGRKSQLRRTVESLPYRKIHWTVPTVGRDVDRIPLKNGMTIYLKEDHRLPLVQLYFLVRTGKIYEPKDKDGLADLTGTLIRTGGTRSMAPEEFDLALDSMGAILRFSIGIEAGFGTMNVRKSDFRSGLKMVADMLRRPAFDLPRLELAKDQLKEAIRRRNDSLDAVANREFGRALYGSHPYGRVLEWETVGKIQREDLLEFHRRYFQPNNIYLAIAGDFDKDDVLTQIDFLFGDWQAVPTDPPTPEKAAGETRRKVILIPRKTNQSRIVYGHFGVDRSDPDIAAIHVMNLILGGGGFTSRIMSRVRSDEGLAYSAGTSFPTDTRDLSAFRGWMQTKTASTHRAIQLSLKEIDRIRNDLVTAEELQTAKRIAENRFFFSLSDPWAAVKRLMELDYEGRPPGFLESYLEQLRSVTKEDVLRVARQRLRPKEIVILVVGDTEKFGSSLSSLGPVEQLTLADPF